MTHFKDKTIFEEEMKIVKKILETKGFILESDHPYAYNMQYGEDLKEVNDWLQENGYKGKLKNQGYFDNVAVYGLYDSDRISYDLMHKKLVEEARSQYRNL